MLPPRFLLLLTLGVALALAFPGVARAQPSPIPKGPAEATAPAITPPVLKKDEGVAYPRSALDAGFRERAEVSLTLTVDATGVVSRALVDAPVGHGFDEAAVAAAQRLVFEPATRDGKPVPARIRFVYKFVPPPGILAGRVVTLAGDRPIVGATVTVRNAAGLEKTVTAEADGSWRMPGLAPGKYHVTVGAPGLVPHEADQDVQAGEEVSSVNRLAPPKPVATTPDAGAPEAVEEVEVHGEKPPREVTKFTIDQREMERIPGTNGDALRSLQNLPGVARSPGLGGLLIVRGSAPEDTQYFVDGTPVPIIYHFGGLSSVVPTEMLGKIDFFPGNFSTQYGRAMGGIVDVGLSSPKSDGLHAMAQADFIDTRAIVQGPLFDTGWNFALAGRRSWFDLWLGPVLTATGANVSVAPVYYDYQAVLERPLGDHQTLRFAFFGSDDRFSILEQSASSSAPTLAGEIGTRTGFWRAQALYDNKVSKDTELRVVGAVGQDYEEFNAGPLFFNLTDTPLTSRVEVAHRGQPPADDERRHRLLLRALLGLGAVPAAPEGGSSADRSFRLPAARRDHGQGVGVRACGVHGVRGDSVEGRAHRAGRRASTTRRRPTPGISRRAWSHGRT